MISSKTFIVIEISITLWPSTTRSILKQIICGLFFLSRTEVLSCLSQVRFVVVGVIRLVSVICSRGNGIVWMISLGLVA